MRADFKIIESPSNPLIKEALKIKKRSKDYPGIFLIEGPHLIEMAIASSFASLKYIFFSEDYAHKKNLKKLLKQIPKAEKVLITDYIVSLLSDTETPQGLVAIVDYKPLNLEDIESHDNYLFIICDTIGDPGNMGTIIRAADAFGADAVIALPSCCDPFNHKSIRATAGSIFNVSVIKLDIEKLFNYLSSKGIILYATGSKAYKNIFDMDFKKSIAIVFGNEASGVSNLMLKRAKEVFKIPISGKAESINVAMAATTCLYEIMRQRTRADL